MAREVFRAFLKLGLTSFGGPVAHLGFFREEFVRRRGWLTDAAYADLVALCQFLPGPASSQVGFAIGYLRGGLAGAFAAWLGFTLPSAALMIACAYGVGWIAPDSGLLQGLKVAAAAVVAHAVLGMAIRLCRGPFLAALAVAAALAGLHAAGPWTQVGVITAGLLLGAGFARPGATDVSPPNRGGSRTASRVGIAGFVGLLLCLPLLASAGGRWTELFAGFFRVGSLVFGGGHVVLPLLESETVGQGWISHDTFLAGYGAAQALPGPLMAFASYLGALCLPGAPAWIGGLWALLAILLPSFLLVLAALPHWERLRGNSRAQAALAGANAAVVGLLFAAFCNPVATNSLVSLPAIAMAAGGFALLQFTRTPPWLVVAICGAAGGFWL